MNDFTWVDNETSYNDSYMVKFNGNSKLFKYLDNAQLFAATRGGATIKPACSSLYFMQFTDVIPVYAEEVPK
jgi:hypothetical protein